MILNTSHITECAPEQVSTTVHFALCTSFLNITSLSMLLYRYNEIITSTKNRQEAVLYVEKKTTDEHLHVSLYVIRPHDLSNTESKAQDLSNSESVAI